MAGTRLARFGPCELRGRGVVRAVGMSMALGPLYGLVKMQYNVADLRANAPWGESHHLSARSSDNECGRGRQFLVIAEEEKTGRVTSLPEVDHHHTIL
jgi:hypothetical protein